MLIISKIVFLVLVEENGSFGGTEKINNKFDISRFIYSQRRFDCFLQLLSSSFIKSLQSQIFYTDFIKLYVIK